MGIMLVDQSVVSYVIDLSFDPQNYTGMIKI